MCTISPCLILSSLQTKHLTHLPIVITLDPAHLLSARAPHALQEPVLLRQSVHAVVALPHRPHEPAQGVHLVLARVAAVLIDSADADLYRRVVLGCDDAVGCAALAGDVAARRGLGLVRCAM